MKSFIDSQPAKYASIVLFLLVSMTTDVRAGEGLDAKQREQIKTIGTALLMAKRSYSPDAQLIDLHDSITQVRQQLEKLTLPVLPSAPITEAHVQSPADIVTVASAELSSQGWRTAHANVIGQLRQARETLRTKNLALRSQGQFSTQGNSSQTGRIVTAPMPQAVLMRLDALDLEIDSAMDMPETERHLALRRLVDELRFNKHPHASIVDTPKHDTPTIINRTTHR